MHGRCSYDMSRLVTRTQDAQCLLLRSRLVDVEDGQKTKDMLKFPSLLIKQDASNEGTADGLTALFSGDGWQQARIRV